MQLRTRIILLLDGKFNSVREMRESRYNKLAIKLILHIISKSIIKAYK
jgi:hypothetical protein